MPLDPRRIWLPLALVVIAFAAAVAPLGPPSLLRSTVQDALHAVGFALLAVVVLRATSGGTWRRTALGLTLLLTVAVGTEALQIVTPRDSDLSDFGRDLLGLAAGIAITATWKRSRRARLVGMLTALVCLSGPAIPAVQASAVLIARQERLPVLLEFRQPWERRLLTLQDATLDFEPGPDGGTAGRITFTGGNYPGIALVEPPHDWTRYDRLSFDVQSVDERTLLLVVRVDDAHHDGEYEDRYQQSFVATPEWTTVDVDLDAVRTGLASRPFDLRRVDTVVWFATPDAPRPSGIRLARVRLETDATARSH